MATVSYGYPGSVNAASLALWLPAVAAAQYSVQGPGDWRVVARTGTDRGITIKAGTGMGDGIMDVVDADVTSLTIPAVAGASSTSRWFMVVARRTWGSTNRTTFVVKSGTSSRQLPARQNVKGEVTEQPLALCRVQGGSSTIAEFVDLRVWGRNGGLFAFDELVRDYLTEVGTSITIGAYRHESYLDNTLALRWRKSPLGGVLAYRHEDWVANKILPVSTSPDGNNIVLARYTIPDPGFPYHAYATATMEGGGPAGTRWDARLAVGSEVVGITRGDAVRPMYRLSGITRRPITGSSVLELNIVRLSGTAAFGLTQYFRELRAMILPAG